MAGNTQMNDNERGVFSIHGVTGMLIATVLLLSILGALQFLGWGAQNAQATNFYKINQDINAIKFNSADNSKHYELVGK
ncbi:MAG: DUF4006 family protein [Candidatus Marinarcus sp.]|uniref:DUF4006 family protein n=1 Tax=Candidatus Marinarcus sp. TaxID=3100987 RepID=UPI003AFF8B31